MANKIKLKADKFVNDKKLKLNYIKTKDLKLLLAEFCEEQIAELKAECDLAIEGRDIRIAELEKENAELKKKCYKKAVKDYCELEKENAKLEKRCTNYEMTISKMEKGTCDVCKETEKDKKIVELETRCNELFLQTCEQAEKIKELEEDNNALQTAYNILKDNDEKIIKEMGEQIEKMKCCGNCTKGNCVNIGQKGKACAYWTSNELRR